MRELSKSIADAVTITRVQLAAYKWLADLLRDDDYLAAQQALDAYDAVGLLDEADD